MATISRLKASAGRVFEYFRQPDKIRLELLVYAHGCYIIGSLKAGYSQLLDQSMSFSREATKKTHNNRRLSGRDQNLAAIHKVQEWRMFLWFKIYAIISTSFMIYLGLRSSLLEALPRLETDHGVHCYLVGRFLMPFYPPMSKTICNITAISHLVWRSVELALKRQLKLNMIFYMIQSESSIQRQLQLFGAEHTDTRLSALYSQAHLTKLDLLLHKILYYAVRHKSQIIFKLRPNRTAKSRRQLTDEIARCSLVCLLSYQLLFVLFAAPIIIELLRDSRYVAEYPGCDPELDRLARGNKLDHWSITVTLHRIYAFLFDLLVNVIVWSDTAFALFLVIGLAYLINYDTLIYWRHLDASLGRLINKIELDRQIVREFPEAESIRSSGSSKFLRQSGIDALAPRRRGADHHSPNELAQLADDISGSPFDANAGQGTTIIDGNYSKRNPPHLHRAYIATRDVENNVLEIQAEIDDFFKQIRNVDLFISDVISGCVFIWLLTFLITTYISISKMAGYAPMFLRLYELSGFAIFSLTNMFLLSMHRKIMSTHRSIVSLMALDQSRHKRRFMKIMDFWTGPNRGAYTLFHRIPFKTSTYLKIIGWTLSTLFVMENLYRGH